MSLTSRLLGIASVIASFVVLTPACSGTHGGSGFGGNGNNGGTSGGGSGSGSGSGSGDDGGGTNNGTGSFGDGGFVDAGGLSGDAGCATGSFAGTKQPVYMLFVLDGSGSMAQNNKWTAVVPALQSIFTDMNTKADPGIAAGLIVFSDTQDSTCGGFNCQGPYPASADVPIAFVGSSQLSSLKNRLSGMPMDGTPTGSAMTGGYTELENYMPSGSNPPPGGKKVMVLITDGVPTDNCAQMAGGSYSSNACVTMAASKLAEAAPKGPIETFVIGVGQFPSTDTTNFDPSFLGYVAQSGGSGPKGCNPAENSNMANLCYFEVDPTTGSASQLQQNFENAINAIRGQVASCTISLSGNNNVDPSKVNVTVNGMTIPQDPTNGWTYDNPSMPTSITLHGTACMDLQGNPKATVQIILGCKTITPM